MAWDCGRVLCLYIALPVVLVAVSLTCIVSSLQILSVVVAHRVQVIHMLVLRLVLQHPLGLSPGGPHAPRQSGHRLSNAIILGDVAVFGVFLRDLVVGSAPQLLDGCGGGLTAALGYVLGDVHLSQGTGDEGAQL